MLLTIQFPLVDARAFLATPTYTLDLPSWLAPLPDSDFVRYFGPIRRRPLGGLTGWVGEGIICEAERALRFRRLSPFMAAIAGRQRWRVRLKVLYRRFYFDGRAVAKFEVGLAIWGFRLYELEPEQTKGLIEHFLRLPVELPNPHGDPQHCQLWQAGKQLAGLYLRSSSDLTQLETESEGLEPWWVQAGQPVLLATHKEYEGLQMPYSGQTVQLKAFDIDSRLAHRIIPFEGQNLGLWQITEGYYDFQRQLRIYLLRLHAERECFRRILRHLATGRIQIAPRSEESQALQHYLNGATQRLARLSMLSQREIDEPTEIGRLARQAEAFIRPGEVDALLATLEALDMRKNIFRKVEAYLQREITIQHIHGDQVLGDKVEGDKVVGDKVVGDKVDSSQMGRESDARPNGRAEP